MSNKYDLTKHKFGIYQEMWDEEALKNQKMLYDFVNFQNQDTFLDAGAFEGSFTKEIISRNKNKDIKCYVFEPMIKKYNMIVNRFDHMENVNIFNYGLSDEDKEEVFYNLGAGSSYINHNSGKTRETVKLLDVHKVFKACNINRVRLMKINIEGGEYSLLPKMIDTGLLDKVDNLLVQFHMFADLDGSKRERIIELIERTHVKSKINFPFVWESWRLK